MRTSLNASVVLSESCEFIGGKLSSALGVLIALLCIAGNSFAAAGPWDSPPALPAPTGTIVNVLAGNASDLVTKVRNAGSNTTILIPAGTYQLTTSTGPMRIGASSAVTNLTLRGATGNRGDVIIRGPGMSNDTSSSCPHCLMVENGKDILIANLSIGDVWYHPITLQGVNGADRVRLYNCRLFDAGEQFLKSNPLNSDGSANGSGYSGASDGIVEYCVFEYTTTARSWYTEGVDVHAGHRWSVRYNLFQNIRGPAGATLVGGAVDFWNRSSNNIVESNTVYNCEVGIRLGVLDRAGYNDHSGGIIRNNFIYRAAGSTNQSDVGIIVNDSPNTQVLHNTVLLNGTYSNAIEIRFAASSGVRVANNLCDANVVLRDGAVGTLTGNRTNATSGLFVNAPAVNLHLLSTATTVINQVAVEANCATDYDGETRPSGVQADIGADEYVSATPQPSVAFNATSSNGAESVTSITIPVSLSASSTQAVSVNYAVTGGTASGSGTDFTLASGTLTFSAGVTTQNIALSVVNDTRDEINETVQITLSSPTNATLGTNTIHTYTINDDDPTPTVAFNATTSAGLESATSVSIPVSLSAASGQTVTVNYAVSGGTGTGSGTDFTLASGTLTFNAGVTTQNISLSVVNDALDENDETVQITLSSPTNATLGTNTIHSYTIQDNDNPPNVAFAATSSGGAESVTSVTIPVSLSASSGLTVTVNYAVTGGTATGGGTDYTLASGTLTFNPGQTSRNISVSVVNDTQVEGNETIVIGLSSPTNATLGTNTSHTYTIQDNDSLPSVAFNAASSSGGEGTASVSIPVSLSAPASAAVSVNYAVTGGTATGGGVDYSLSSGTLNFAIGETTKNIALTVVSDLINEANETVVIGLSSPTNATLGATSSHTFTINNKFTPTITWSNPSPIKYPTALSATELNATTTVAGTFVYTPPLGTVLKAGNGQTLSVQFTPTDTATNNSPAPKTVLINVFKGSAKATLGTLSQVFDGSPKSVSVTTTPAGLNVSVTYDGSASAPSAAGSYVVLASVNDANYDGSVSGTLTISSGPTIDSSPTPSANPAIAGQAVQYTIGVSAPGPLTYRWDFGDGTAAFSGASASHVFASAGTYVVKVTVSDANGAQSTASLTQTVNAAGGGGGPLDSDGDGVSDADEIAAGTNPFSAGSASKIPMSVSKLQGSAKFNATGKDACSVSGVIPGLPAFFDPNGKSVTLSVGGAAAIFTLDARGHGKPDSGTLMLKLKGKRNKATKKMEFAGGDVPFKATLRRGAWADEWSALGVDAAQSALKAPLTVTVDLSLDGKVYSAGVPALYSAKAGIGGVFKAQVMRK